MALSINTSGTYKVVRVNNADALTNWSATKLEGAGGSPSAFASVGSIDLVQEGTDAVASIANKQRVLLAHTTAAGFDFTAAGTGTGSTKVPDGIVYMWAAFLAAGSAFTKANGGLQLALGDGTNTSYWNIAGSDTYSGGFIKWAVLTTVTPDETSGTAATLGDITSIGFVCDVGGTTTRFDNMVVDAIDTGLGLTFTGTTTTDKLFSEAQVVDKATEIGVLENYNDEIFCQGSLLFSGTAMTSIAETLVFKDTLGGAYTYDCDVTGTMVMTNSSIKASGAVDYNFDTSGATAFTMNGGGIGGFNTLVTGASQTINGAVFSAGGASTVANTITNSAFNQCGLITVNGALTGCTINEGTGTVAVSTSALSKITKNSFISDGTGHAVDLGTISTTQSMTWDNTDSGYAATDGSTGNETILVSVAISQTLTINVSATGTTPTIYNTGAGTVSVVAGQKTFSFTVNPSITAYEWRLYSVTAVGSLAGSVELDGEESATVDNQSYSYSYTADTPVAVQIIGKANDTVESITYYTLGNADQDVSINLTKDNNN